MITSGIAWRNIDVTVTIGILQSSQTGAGNLIAVYVITSGQHAEKGAKPLRIFRKIWWQLKQYHADFWSKRAETCVHQGDRVFAFRRHPASGPLPALPAM